MPKLRTPRTSVKNRAGDQSSAARAAKPAAVPRAKPAASPRRDGRKTPTAASSLQSLLSEASRKATADLERVLRPKGIPVEYWRVLEVLADESGRPMTALADAVSMRLPTLSKLIDRMVADALVQRAPDPQDLRRVLVYISDPGLQLVTGLRDKVRRQRFALEASLGEHGAALKRLLAAFIGESRS